MRSLYEINTDLENAMQQAEGMAMDNDGEISDYLSDLLDGFKTERDTKIGNICRYYKSLLAESEMVSDEAKALTERAKQTKNKAESLKSYLSSMIQPGETYADENSKISWRGSESVEISLDVKLETLPSEYVKTELTPKKTELKNAIKSGVVFTGITISKNQNIQIK